MTREEVIKMFKSMIKGKSQLNACGIHSKYDFRCGESFFKALEMAIEVLEQKPCDCISRKAVIEHYNSGEILQCNHVSRNNLLNYIEDLPPVTPKPKTGHWIEPEDKPIGNGYCSVCGYHPQIYPITFKHCPDCGCKMLPTGSDCGSCECQNEVDGSNCYECVKGIRNNYKAKSEDKE